MPFSVSEPHPTALPNHRVHTGRGGAGNTFRVSSNAAAPLTLTSTNMTNKSSATQSATSKFSSGRGGAGNIHPISSAAVYSFDEEMEAQTSREQHHDTWHVGRGGAGNWTTKKPAGASERKMSNESAASGASSTRSGFMGRLSGVFTH
jgi:hypothetical protein